MTLDHDPGQNKSKKRPTSKSQSHVTDLIDHFFRFRLVHSFRSFLSLVTHTHTHSLSVSVYAIQFGTFCSPTETCRLQSNNNSMKIKTIPFYFHRCDLMIFRTLIFTPAFLVFNLIFIVMQQRKSMKWA